MSEQTCGNCRHFFPRLEPPFEGGRIVTMEQVPQEHHRKERAPLGHCRLGPGLPVDVDPVHLDENTGCPLKLATSSCGQWEAEEEKPAKSQAKKPGAKK